MTFVQVEGNEVVRTLTLRDPDRRNALSGALLRELIEALSDASRQGVRVAILTTDPVHGVWSSGHDITELPDGDRDPLTWDNPLEEALRAIRGCPFPVIAAIDGSVWGGACDLAITCDLIVATESSQFAITPTRLGIPYNTEGTAHFLSALPVHVVKEMFFTADPIDAVRAWHLGIINELTADREALIASTDRWARRITSRAPLAIAAIKAEISTLSDARHLTSNEFERLNSLRTKAWMSQDYREGLAAFRERRDPSFRGR
jgi:methylmalonyl-CoA decarboxylase